MKIVTPEIRFDMEIAPEKHVGWIWLVKMREGDEEAEDAWIAENPRDAISKAQTRYPDAKLVSCHRRDEITNYSAVRTMLDGRVLPF